MSATGAPLTGEAGTARSDFPRLLVEHASFAYHAARRVPQFTLEAVSFRAQCGELVTIVGPNASGKTTLLRLLSGVLRPLGGRVELEGVEVGRLDPRTRARRIAMVQQESTLVFPVRALEYVLQGRYPYSRGLRFAKEDDLSLATRALEQVSGAHLAERWMAELSGGEKQRVVLARALAQQPLLLLLDEPTLHLDIGGQVELLRQLAGLAGTGQVAIVVVTHELSLAAEFADQVVLMRKGRALGVGRPGEVLEESVLREVFRAPLRVEAGPGGRPRIRLEVRMD
ncbi:MAG TPA: ABC transporter ATP-binding protein [Candidatus Dormibacteraeota bacterium]|nr:ABC transporter ATP-binding protein [Candidatus Dormibacteraeota bacterium]